MAITFNPQESYPQNQTNNFPIGEEIILEFSNLVDLKSAKEAIIIYGDDSDRTIIGDSTYLNDFNDIKNFLRSPGEKGYVEVSTEVFDVDGSGDVLNNTYFEKPANQTSIVVIKPKKLLEANKEHILYILGSAVESIEGLTSKHIGNALSVRTIYDPKNTTTNALDDRLKLHGTYTGSTEETLNIRIVTAGNGSNAKYIWWFSDEQQPQPSGRRLNKTSQRWRNLDRGVVIKFLGGEFELDDVIQVKVYPKDKLETSYKLTFNTSTEDLVTKPAHVSTSDIGVSDQIPSVTVSNNEPLRIIDMQPRNGSVNNSLDTNKITITFNQNIDSTTAIQEYIKLYKQNVSGSYHKQNQLQKLPKEITVDNNKIILEF